MTAERFVTFNERGLCMYDDDATAGSSLPLSGEARATPPTVVAESAIEAPADSPLTRFALTVGKIAGEVWLELRDPANQAATFDFAKLTWRAGRASSGESLAIALAKAIYLAGRSVKCVLEELHATTATQTPEA